MIIIYIWSLRIVWSPRQCKTSNTTALVIGTQCFPAPQHPLDKAGYVSAWAPNALSTLPTSPLPAAWTCSLGKLPMFAKDFFLLPSLHRQLSFSVVKCHQLCTVDSIWLSCPFTLNMFFTQLSSAKWEQPNKGEGSKGCTEVLITAKIMKRMESFVNMSQEAKQDKAISQKFKILYA